jgi:hypothetical protein
MGQVGRFAEICPGLGYIRWVNHKRSFASNPDGLITRKNQHQCFPVFDVRLGQADQRMRLAMKLNDDKKL